jgi:hypothetical protein
MHNLHLVVLKAEDAQDACDTVESQIEDYGNENNWRTICGCVSEDNEVYIHDKSGRYPPEANETIESINAMVRKWVNSEGSFSGAAIAKLKKEPDFTKWTDSLALWSLGKYVDELRYKAELNGEEFDVLQHSYANGVYDECGVTQLDVWEEEDTKTYVVFVDMHS